MNAVLGRKVTSSRGIGHVTSTARDMSKISKESDDVRRAEAKLADHRERLVEIEAELAVETESLDRKYDPFLEEFTVIQLKPRKADIDIRTYGVIWVPHERIGNGKPRPLS